MADRDSELAEMGTSINKKPAQGSRRKVHGKGIGELIRLLCQLMVKNDPASLTSGAKAMAVKKLRRTGPASLW